WADVPFRRNAVFPSMNCSKARLHQPAYGDRVRRYEATNSAKSVNVTTPRAILTENESSTIVRSCRLVPRQFLTCQGSCQSGAFPCVGRAGNLVIPADLVRPGANGLNSC